MTSPPFLVRLSQLLADRLQDFPLDRRTRHRRFVLTQQTADGGFRGREGDSDMYYTAFAVRCLGLLGGMSSEECHRVAGYLANHDWRTLGAIDLLNFVYTSLAVQTFSGIDPFAGESAGWDDELLARLEALRTADGGYAKSAQGAAGSTYHSFLVLLTYQLLGRSVPLPNRLGQFFFDMQRDDGGFVEIAPMKRSGTNPTAAATESLQLLGAMDDELRRDIQGFLMEVRSGDGGFQANSRIPFPDGLSTFTALLTLRDLGIPLQNVVPPHQVATFVTHRETGLEFPTGGFRGAAWDQAADVEYTFYALGILALLGKDHF